MTRGSIREYTEAVRGRYLWASKKEKNRILDEFTKVIGELAADMYKSSDKVEQGKAESSCLLLYLDILDLNSVYQYNVAMLRIHTRLGGCYG